MKSKYHDSLVELLKSPSMVGGLSRFSPDALMTAVALCTNIPVRPASNRLLLAELWETEYRQQIRKPLLELRKDVFVDVPLIEELARQIMTGRCWAHTMSMFSSETVQSYLREQHQASEGAPDEGDVFEVMALIASSELNMSRNDIEMMLASHRMADSVRDSIGRVDRIAIDQTLRRTQVANIHAMARNILRIESQWWEMIEKFNHPTSDAAREFVEHVFSNYPEVYGDDKLNIVIAEAFNRLGKLRVGSTEPDPEVKSELSLEAFYGV